MSVPVRILPNYTYADYLHWEGKWEVIEGIPHAMSPSPIPRHQLVSANLSAAFRNALKGSCKKFKIYQPLDYRISDDTILQPDLLIVCKDITEKFLDFRPELVVEILSPSTALKDRHTKFGLYEKEQIPYYLIIDPVVNEMEIFALGDQQAYTLSSKGNSFDFSFQLADCDVPVSFTDVWE